MLKPLSGWTDCLVPWSAGCAAYVAGQYAPVPYTGVPPAPPQDVWTVPPANGQDAQQTVDVLVNQGTKNQQAWNAYGVDTTPASQVGGALYNAGQAVSNALTSPWLIAGLTAAGLIALIVLVKR